MDTTKKELLENHPSDPDTPVNTPVDDSPVSDSTIDITTETQEQETFAESPSQEAAQEDYADTVQEDANETPEQTETYAGDEASLSQTPRKKKKKKRHMGLWIVLLVLILAAGGFGTYYFMMRQQPEKTVEAFLDSMQKLDLTSMENMLQSHDLSALENADIRNDAYKDFFTSINSKMTYKITKNKFSMSNDTAQITAHIKYIDGAEIYKETISEFLRQIVSSAFSGKDMTEAETQAKLATILNEKAASTEDTFAETDITYPVIKTNNEWKIVSLDDETVKIMSANFKSVEDEINQSLVDMESGSTQTDTTASQNDTIDMTTDTFTIHYTQYRISTDFAGSPCLLFYYDYTNNGTTDSSAMVDVNIQASQNGTSLSAAIPADNDSALDQFMAEIKPGQTVNVCQAFSLTDTSDVTLKAGAAFSFGGGSTTSQVLKVQ